MPSSGLSSSTMTPRPHSQPGVISSFWAHRELVWQLTLRDVAERYRGSALGLLWSLFTPLLMLAVYTFVFGVVFQARWGQTPLDKGELAATLFTGLIIHGFFAECVNKAPSLIISHANYVKKVRFPLEILPWVSLGSALFHLGTSLLILLFFQVLLGHPLHWTLLLLPLVIIPLALLVSGAAWFLAAVGVYLRDVAQAIGLFSTAMLFLSPIFYPLSAVPEPIRPWLLLNPLTFIIEQARLLVIVGGLPDWRGLALYTTFALLAAWLGFRFFNKARRGFADVI